MTKRFHCHCVATWFKAYCECLFEARPVTVLLMTRQLEFLWGPGGIE